VTAEKKSAAEKAKAEAAAAAAKVAGAKLKDAQKKFVAKHGEVKLAAEGKKAKLVTAKGICSTLTEAGVTEQVETLRAEGKDDEADHLQDEWDGCTGTENHPESHPTSHTPPKDCSKFKTDTKEYKDCSATDKKTPSDNNTEEALKDIATSDSYGASPDATSADAGPGEGLPALHLKSAKKIVDDKKAAKKTNDKKVEKKDAKKVEEKDAKKVEEKKAEKKDIKKVEAKKEAEKVPVHALKVESKTVKVDTKVESKIVAKKVEAKQEEAKKNFVAAKKDLKKEEGVVSHLMSKVKSLFHFA